MSDTAPSAPPPFNNGVAPDPLIGTRLNKIQIVRPLDGGGMGTIYLGVNYELDKQYAIKVSTAEHDPDMKGRALLEAKALSKLDHPNIVQVFDAWTLDDGRLAIVMPLLSGQSLSRYIEEQPDGSSRPLSTREALLFAVQLARGLGEAHRHGFVHRDLKPGNVFVTRRDIELEGSKIPEIKLLDFGLVRSSIPHWQPLRLPGSRASGGDTIACGTPEYVSPEQATGTANIDGRSDLYSLGVLLFELLCGRLPFVPPRGMPPREQVVSLLHQHATAPAPRAITWAGHLPKPLEELIAQLLEKSPQSRPQSAKVVEERLREILRGLPRERRSRRPVLLAAAAGLGLAAGLAALAWSWAWRAPPTPVVVQPPVARSPAPDAGPEAPAPPDAGALAGTDPTPVAPPAAQVGPPDASSEPVVAPTPKPVVHAPLKPVRKPPRVVATGEACTPDERWRGAMLENLRDLGRQTRDDPKAFATWKAGDARLSRLIRDANTPEECGQANALFEGLRRSISQ